MKKVSILLFLVAVFLVRAQDTTLPQGICGAHLYSGKTIKNIRLWKLHSNRVEYLKDDNLHDLMISEINYLDFPGAQYSFSDSSTLLKKEYDLIVLNEEDSIHCFIREIGIIRVFYTLPGSTQVFSVARGEVVKLVLKGKEEVLTPVGQTHAEPVQTRGVKHTPPNADSVETTTVTEVNYYKMGLADGKREYRGNGSLTGGLFCGFIPLAGWLATPIVLAVNPRVAPSKTGLYLTNKDYKEGYRIGAKRKKAIKTMAGFVIGVLTFFAIVI